MRAYRSRVRAWHLWLVVAGVVVAVEALAPPGELLSEGVDRAMEQHPFLTRLVVELVARHLTNDLPPQCDPISRLAGLFS